MSQFERLFSRDEVAAMIAEALSIVDELDPPGDLRVTAFTTALNIIGQHAQTVSPVALPAR